MIFPCLALSKSRKHSKSAHFLQKWLLSRVFAVPIDTNTYASIRFVSICPFDSLYHFSASTATLFGNGRKIFSTIKKEHIISIAPITNRTPGCSPRIRIERIHPNTLSKERITPLVEVFTYFCPNTLSKYGTTVQKTAR